MTVFYDFPGPSETRAEDMSYVRLCGDQFTLHGSHSTISLVNLSYAHICFSSTDIPLISDTLTCQVRITAPAVLNHRNPIGFATKNLWERHPIIPGKA